MQYITTVSGLYSIVQLLYRVYKIQDSKIKWYYDLAVCDLQGEVEEGFPLVPSHMWGSEPLHIPTTSKGECQGTYNVLVKQFTGGELSLVVLLTLILLDFLKNTVFEFS